jgi:acetyl esterase
MKPSCHPPISPLDRAFRLSWRNDDIAVRVYGARSGREGLPLVLYFHGGLFNCGSVQDAEQFAHALSRVAVLVCVEYPLAPGFRFPETVEVAFEALQWASAQAAGFGASAARIIVAGDQAGGNLAAATALVARDRSAPANRLRPLAGQILITPLLDPSQASVSMRQTADTPCRKGWAEYIAYMSDATHPYAAPVHSLRLGNLPPALILSAELCPLRDEAEEYAAKLIAAGVPVRVRRLEKAKGNVVHPAHLWFGPVVEMVSQFVTESR